MAITIKTDTQSIISLIKSINLGGPVAEHDALLFEARIETPAFYDLYCDRVDLIPGTKGSGKTALFRLMSEKFSQVMFKTTRIVLLTGVEATGDPVFQAFKDKFEDLTENEFENFWRVYFVALILERFVKNEQYADILDNAKKEIDEFKIKCRAANIPEVEQKSTFRDIVQGVLRCITFRVGNVESGPAGSSFTALEVAPSEGDAKNMNVKIEQPPLFLNGIHDAMISVLQKAGVGIWIMLDRLDEVFPRRTKLERNALRALLRTTRNFTTPLIRIKIFLRDDIFENILNGNDGFTALSHIEARKAATLSWGPEEIQLLIVKRIAHNLMVRRLYTIDNDLISKNDMSYAAEVFYKLFPLQVMSGKNQSKTLDWIYHHCKDGCGVVTPRDVIDLLEFALKSQMEHLQRGVCDVTYLVGAQALREALVKLSVKKCRTYLEAEFPGFWPFIKCFKGHKAEHNSTSLEHLLGGKWNSIVDDLVSIGFLMHRPRAGTYLVATLFRAGMDIRQGKAFKSCLSHKSGEIIS
jgi:hypothetical protein